MTAEDSLAIDSANRERALALESFIIEAPAGAGKTELLTQRYLKLLAHVEAPEEILAITFTNKAAAEMRARILQSLERAERGDYPAEPHRQITFKLAQQALHHAARQGWPLINAPARLRIFTIDALSAQLARQLPLLSRFGAQPVISDEPLRHYEEAARRTLALLQDETSGAAELVSQAVRLCHHDPRRLRGLLAAMLARREQWLPYCAAEDLSQLTARAHHGLQQLLSKDLEEVLNVIPARVQKRLQPLIRYAASHLQAEAKSDDLAVLLDWQQVLEARIEDLPAWRALADALLTQKNEFRKTVTKTQGFPAKSGTSHKEDFLALLAELAADPKTAATLARVRTLPDSSSSARAQNDQAVVVMASLLKLAAAQLWLVFHEAGQTDFVEVALRAQDALGAVDSPSELALALDYRISHLLVDEFQDTSPLQVELLQRLTAGWQANDGRTLFCVGDPMQSIYRFRKADVGLFLQAATQGIAGVPLTALRLYRNNRSCPSIVSWINKAFAQIFPAADRISSGAIRYRPFVAARTESMQEAAGVYVHLLPALTTPAKACAAESTDATNDQLEAQEAAAQPAEVLRMLEIIELELQSHPDRRIAVLVRARNHLQGLVELLRRERPGLRFQAVDVEALHQRQVVQDVLILCRALLHRADRLHWLALLRAPWCGLTLADLHALCADQPNATIWQLLQDEARLQRLSADGQQRLRHVRQVIAQAYAHQGRSRLRRWLETIWWQLGGAQTLAITGDARAAVDDVQAVFELIDQLDIQGRFSLDQLEQELQRLYAAPDALADGRLQLMTIHKSKGLEFDTVILPSLNSGTRGDDAPLLLWEEVALDTETCLLAATKASGKQSSGSIPDIYDYLQTLEAERTANEALRVLYVAATRAIRRLHLLATVDSDKDGQLKASKGSFASLLWDVPEVVAERRLLAENGGLLASGQGAGPETASGTLAAVASQHSGSEPFVDVFVAPLLRLQTLPAHHVDGVSGQNESPLFMRAENSWAATPAGPANSANSANPASPPEAVITTTPQAWAPAAPDSAQNIWAAACGRLLHRYLELLCGQDLSSWTAERVSALQPSMQRWLQQQELGPAQAAEGAQRVILALQTTLASKQGRWLLQAHQQDGVELALTQMAGSQVQRHVVDRCFVAENERWIIDYKTTLFDAAVLTEPAHWQRAAQVHRPQLERYAALFAEENLPVRLAIFFAAHGELVLLD